MNQVRVRKRIIERILDYAMGSFTPSHFTIYTDAADVLPVRFLLSGRPCLAEGVKADNYTVVCTLADDADWPEFHCEHEWSAIAHRENRSTGKFRVWYCDRCAAIGPRKAQTQQEVIDRAERAGFPMRGFRAAGMLKQGPLIAEQ